jgi:hypothetical protein
MHSSTLDERDDHVAESIGYVPHHVKVAAYDESTLFTDNAIQRIFEYTRGVARRQRGGSPRQSPRGAP